MEEKEEKKSGLCTAGLVLGIVGICTSFIPLINNLSFVLGILAIIFGLCSIKKAGKGKLIATIILGILTIIIVIQSQQALVDSIDEAFSDLDDSLSDVTGENTETILENNVNVTFGEFEATTDEYGFTETKLTATVKNISDESKSFSITVEAVTADGTRIDTDYIYANSLSAGQSQNFEIFTYVSDDDLDDMKTATFNIVEVSMY